MKKGFGSTDYLGVVNVLMQLRKVCCHPDLFEVRKAVEPFVQGINVSVKIPRGLVCYG